MKNVVITGGSRGIGYGLAKEFLKKGHAVTISGRNAETLKLAAEALKIETGNNNVESLASDVCLPEGIRELWNKASKTGPVDIWINNAGLGQASQALTELDINSINNILDTNIKGLVLCSKIVLEGMIAQGCGAIYNMEGFGSDGRKMKNMSIYGTSKSAVRYFTKSLILETKDLPLIIGTISPGMVVTDLLTSPISSDMAERKQALKIFHILADKVETVTPFLVDGILKNKTHGKALSWLNGRKIMGRFVLNIFRKRKLDGLPEL